MIIEKTGKQIQGLRNISVPNTWIALGYGKCFVPRGLLLYPKC